MKKKSYLAFLLVIVVFFSFGSRAFGINGEGVDGTITATFSCGAKCPLDKFAESKSVTITIDSENAKKILSLWGIKGEFLKTTVSGTLAHDRNTGGTNLVLHLENDKGSNIITDEDALSSCDCYNKSGQKTKHYDGSSKMYKEVMCHHYCCRVDEEYGYQWGANIDPSAAIVECGS